MQQRKAQVAAAAELSQPKPFVKWAGGKRQLIPALTANMPQEFKRYFEPFVGGGALFYHIASGQMMRDDNGSSKKHSRYVISDLNRELIASYVAIRDRPKDLIRMLQHHAKEYAKDPESYYYHVRDNDDTPANADCDESLYTASRLIFLNRTCFNGLYRVNRRGKFNVPIGRYTNPNIANVENIMATSRMLESAGVDILCEGYENVAKHARRGDFVYFDPPYLPVSDTAKFTMYTGCDFGLDDQKRLAELCVRLHEAGCKVLLSNSNSDIISDMFALDEWTVVKVAASRCINSVSAKRSGHAELLIRNY